jgi:dTDP-4-dehydrorhamnose reductase
MTKAKKVLILGASGMLGNAVLRVFVDSPDFIAMGSIRGQNPPAGMLPKLRGHLIPGVNVENQDSLIALFEQFRPDVVVNCVGLVKQLSGVDDPLTTLPVNALLPHRLARLSALVGARLVHISTDCVFNGTRGNYTEADIPDALDLYGRSKLLGEVDYPNSVTLRTSIIGTELVSAHGLIGWFLNQTGSVKGFTRAVFSGLPTVALAEVIRDHVIPRPELRGMWHVSADPIAKFDLLSLVAKTYGKEIDIQPDDDLAIDRSLDSTRFQRETGWRAAPWPELVAAMQRFG